MRVAIFTDTYAPEINGVARTLSRLTEYMEKKGIAYRVFAPESGTPVPTVPQVRRLASLPFVLYPECRMALANPLSLQRELKAFCPDVLHIATPFALGLYGMAYGKKHHIPMVASYHTHFDEYLHYYHLEFMQNWIWRFMRWFHQPMQTVYVPSVSTKEKVEQFGLHPNIEVWGRGVDAVRFSPHRKNVDLKRRYGIREKYVLLYVGRMAPEKDVQTAIDAFHSLPAHIREDTHMILAGDGPLLKALREQHHPQMTFTGFVEGSQLAELYASADVFVFPSATETFGNVVLEALASGLPVIGARAGGVQHVVQDQRNGLLCEQGQTEQFTAAIRMLLYDQAQRERYAKEARRFAQLRSWDAVLKKLIDGYAQVSRQGVVQGGNTRSA
jgi:glycosyltransferase involved in cell wall biosynthesis